MNDYSSSLRVIFLAALFLTSAKLVYAEELSREALQTLSDAVSSKMENFNPLRVKYTIHDNRKKEYWVDLLGAPAPLPKGAEHLDVPREYSDGEVTIHADLGYKGDKHYFLYSMPDILMGKPCPNIRDSVIVFDGKKIFRYESRTFNNAEDMPMYGVSPNEERHFFGCAMPTMLSGDSYVPFLARTLKDTSGDHLVSGHREKAENGDSLVYLEFHRKTIPSFYLKIWLQETKEGEYLVQKSESTSGIPSSKAVEHVSNVRYEKLDGKFYPVGAVVTTTLGDKIIREQLYEATSTETRGNKIPDSLFKMKIPRNAVLYDLDTSQIIVDPAITKEYLDSIPLWKHQRFWLVLVVNLALFVLILYINRARILALIWKQ